MNTQLINIVNNILQQQSNNLSSNEIFSLISILILFRLTDTFNKQEAIPQNTDESQNLNANSNNISNVRN